MENETIAKKKWYKTPVGIIALLILFFPAGLYLMWKYSGWNKTAKWIITGVFGFFILVSMISGDSSKTSTSTTQPTQTVQATQAPQEPTKKPEPTKDTSQHELDAIIKFNDLAFLITNNEKDDWTDCKFEMNSGLFSGGYVFRVDVLESQNPLIVPFREFTKGDGTRFNSEATKPQNVSVSCDVKGVHGFNYFGIK